MKTLSVTIPLLFINLTAAAAAALINARSGSSIMTRRVERLRRNHAFILKSSVSSNMNEGDPNMIEAFRSSLEKSYDKYDYFDERLGYLDDDESLLLRARSQNKLRRDTSSDASVYGSDSDWGDVCGEDCDQCDIPDDFKILGNQKSDDVMSFLGIRRAEPLRVEQKQETTEWE